MTKYVVLFTENYIIHCKLWIVLH